MCAGRLKKVMEKYERSRRVITKVKVSRLIGVLVIASYYLHIIVRESIHIGIESCRADMNKLYRNGLSTLIWDTAGIFAVKRYCTLFIWNLTSVLDDIWVMI